MTSTTTASPSVPVTVGAIAPDFTLKDQDDKEFRLTDYRGKKPVVLYFYPLDWSPTCTVENKCFTTDLTQFSKLAEVAAISVDSVWSHKAWARELGLGHRLLSDVHRRVIKAYGLWLEPANISQRATVLVDKEGRVAWVKVQKDVTQARDTQEVLAKLKSIV